MPPDTKKLPKKPRTMLKKKTIKKTGGPTRPTKRLQQGHHLSERKNIHKNDKHIVRKGPLRVKNKPKIKNKKKKKVGWKKMENLKSEGINLDRAGATTRMNHRGFQPGTKNVLGQDATEDKEKELVSDLFGEDDDADPTPEPLRPKSEATDVEDKKVKKIKIEEMEVKQMIPDDPFDIHGAAVKDQRRPAWFDEDDQNVKVKDVVANMTKARGSRGVRETSEQQYSETLAERFTQVYGGTPEWAALDQDTQDEDDKELVRSTGNYLSKSSGGALPKSHVDYQYVMDLNENSRSEGAVISAVEFNSSLPVGLVAGFTVKVVGAATLFKVDGSFNHVIQSVKFPNFPIKCAKFLADGRKFVAGSNLHGFFYVYDLETGKYNKIPSNIWTEKWNMKNFKVSPDGKLLVSVGKAGLLYIFDTQTMSHIDTLYAPQQVSAITFSVNGSKMYSHSVGGDVFVWDMDSRQCVHRFYDDGCVDGTSIALSGCHLACGSSSGVVNIYDTTTLSSSPSPKPLKALDKLYTPVTSLAFNSSGEILGCASSEVENGLKMVHFPSMTYFTNFPHPQWKLRKIQTVSFTPHSGFIALGNNVGSVKLTRLHHYPEY